MFRFLKQFFGVGVRKAQFNDIDPAYAMLPTSKPSHFLRKHATPKAPDPDPADLIRDFYQKKQEELGGLASLRMHCPNDVS